MSSEAKLWYVQCRQSDSRMMRDPAGRRAATVRYTGGQVISFMPPSAYSHVGQKEHHTQHRMSKAQ